MISERVVAGKKILIAERATGLKCDITNSVSLLGSRIINLTFFLMVGERCIKKVRWTGVP
jgi:hypothetical protein